SIVKNETKFGRWLRSNKLDELPQIFNVLTGNMSLIGPRPDVAGYADRLEGDDRIILSVKPGITGPATIKYRNEDQLLLQQEDSKSFNDEVIWPDKIIINKNYIKNWSLRKDIGYLFASLVN
ncbi:MAG: lipopolysaccharide/colanic/teichoic acid biosynthesis glycosyltransferase, partial [Flavobacteriaceae bacterium]